MKHSESIKNLVKALFDFNKNYTAPSKDEKVIRKGGGSYNYLTLDGLITSIRPQLLDVGLLFIQPLNDSTITTRIIHTSGEWLQSTEKIPTLSAANLGNDVQQYGAAISYMRRYCLTSILGISTGEDTDGVTKTTQPAQTQYKRTSTPPRSNAPSDAQKGKLRGNLEQLAKVDKAAADKLKAEINKHAENKTWNRTLCSAYIDKSKEAMDAAQNPDGGENVPF